MVHATVSLTMGPLQIYAMREFPMELPFKIEKAPHLQRFLYLCKVWSFFYAKNV